MATVQDVFLCKDMISTCSWVFWRLLVGSCSLLPVPFQINEEQFLIVADGDYKACAS